MTELAGLIGDWRGVTEVAATAWGPAHHADGHVRITAAPGGGLLIAYEQTGDSALSGHGVVQDGRWWWFDSLGFTPEAPGSAEFTADGLRLTRTSERGRNVTTFRVPEPEMLIQEIDVAVPADAGLEPIVRGRYLAGGRHEPAPSVDRPAEGGCLCGGVRYRLTAPFRRANLCHCSRCRKHSGAPALAQGRIPREGFALLQGSELVRVFHPPDGGMVKVFCERCGSSLFGGRWPDGPEVSIRLGTLDGHPGIAPQYHSHAASAAPWDTLPDDGLPRYPAGPPPRPR